MAEGFIDGFMDNSPTYQLADCESSQRTYRTFKWRRPAIKRGCYSDGPLQGYRVRVSRVRIRVEVLYRQTRYDTILHDTIHYIYMRHLIAKKLTKATLVCRTEPNKRLMKELKTKTEMLRRKVQS